MEEPDTLIERQDNTAAVAKSSANYRQLVVLGLATAAAVDFFHRQIIAIALGPLGQDLHLSDTQRGLLVAAYAFAYALSSLVLPHFTARYNRRWVISGAVAVSGILALLSGMMQSYAAILLCRAGIGMAIAIVAPVSQAIIAENITLEDSSRVQGTVAAGAPIGVIIGLGLWGWITESYGWQFGLSLSGMVTLVIAALLFITIGEQRRTAAPGDGESLSFVSSLRHLWHIKTYRHMVLGFSLTGVAAMGAVQWLPIFFMRYHGLDIKTVGMVLAGIVGVVGTLSVLLSGALGARISPRDSAGPMWISAGGAITATPLFIAAYFLPSTVAVVALLSLATLLGFMIPPQFFMVVQTVVTLPLRAFASGVAMALFTAFGLGGGVTLTGVISELALWGDESLRYSLSFVTLFYLWGAVHILLAARFCESEKV
jgi:predicted MFS family arabinose efflux permease